MGFNAGAVTVWVGSQDGTGFSSGWGFLAKGGASAPPIVFTSICGLVTTTPLGILNGCNIGHPTSVGGGSGGGLGGVGSGVGSGTSMHIKVSYYCMEGIL